MRSLNKSHTKFGLLFALIAGIGDIATAAIINGSYGGEIVGIMQYDSLGRSYFSDSLTVGGKVISVGQSISGAFSYNNNLVSSTGPYYVGTGGASASYGFQPNGLSSSLRIGNFSWAAAPAAPAPSFSGYHGVYLANNVNSYYNTGQRIDEFRVSSYSEQYAGSRLDIRFDQRLSGGNPSLLSSTGLPTTQGAFRFPGTMDSVGQGAECFSITAPDGTIAGGLLDIQMGAGIDSFASIVFDIAPGTVSLKQKPTTAYGIFLGDSDATAAGATDAKNLQSAMIQSGLIAKGNTVYLSNQQITVSAIESALANFGLTDGDKLYFYFSGHGGNVTGGGETTATAKDEFLALTNDPYIISDDQLHQILRKYDGIDKWVMLDSCFAGGFWGNNQENGGDLEQLKHIALLAAASETEYSHSLFTDQSGIFTRGLISAFSTTSNGFLRADGDKSGILTFIELETYLNDIDWMIPYFQTYAYLKDGVGDLVWLDETSYARPFVASSADFVGSITADQASVPEPGTMALLTFALAGLAATRRRTH